MHTRPIAPGRRAGGYRRRMRRSLTRRDPARRGEPPPPRPCRTIAFACTEHNLVQQHGRPCHDRPAARGWPASCGRPALRPVRARPRRARSTARQRRGAAG